MDRQGIDQFVRDDDAFDRGRETVAGIHEPVRDIAKDGALRGPRFRAGLVQVEARAIVETRMTAARRAQNIRRQPAVAGAGL
jgi:hypothetical protein